MTYLLMPAACVNDQKMKAETQQHTHSHSNAEATNASVQHNVLSKKCFSLEAGDIIALKATIAVKDKCV